MTCSWAVLCETESCVSTFFKQTQIPLWRGVLGCSFENCSWRHVSNFRILIADYTTELMSLLKMTHLSLVVFVRMWFEGLICRYIECAFPILGAEGTVIINQSFISFGSHKMMYFSQGLMLSSNICLKERCLIWTAHLKDVFCVLLFKGTLTSVVFLVLLFTLEL